MAAGCQALLCPGEYRRCLWIEYLYASESMETAVLQPVSASCQRGRMAFEHIVFSNDLCGQQPGHSQKPFHANWRLRASHRRGYVAESPFLETPRLSRQPMPWHVAVEFTAWFRTDGISENRPVLGQKFHN